MLLNIYFMHSDYFFMDNLLPQSLYPLIMVIIVKKPGGGNCSFYRNQSAADIILNR